MVNASSSTSAPDLYVVLGDTEPANANISIALARTLNIPCLTAGEAANCSGLFLQFRDQQLKLGRIGGPEHPVSVDFVSSLLSPRRGPELLLKAIGGGQPRPSVVDATAGLGRDSVILLGAGYSVTMIEENAVVAALLDDALTRLRAEFSCAAFAANLSLVAGRAEQYLPELAATGHADVIYLDPMFAVSGKSALVKKEMQLFQHLLGHGDDGSGLLDTALSLATYRVVVKRAIKAPPLASREPTLAVSGKAVRFDVYALRSFKRR